ncbi:MAG: aminopeptidase [Nitrososphaeria archaeon]|nr:aminopeptidase [Nitrososphaeria archaeon]
MADVRITRLAQLITEYSVSIREGDEVVIRAGIEALPLIRELVREIVSRGAYPHMLIQDSAAEEIFYRYARENVLKNLSPLDKFIMENVDAMISIISDSHSKPLINVNPERLKIRQAARAELNEIFMRRQASGELRWNVTLYPTNALAQEAGMGPIEYEEYVFKACMVDRDNSIDSWKEQARKQEEIVKLLSKIDELKITSDEIDLVLKVGGRKWINDDGHHNMPAGEVFSAPIEDSAEGYVKFDYPSVWRGFEVEGVKLKFRRGEVVETYAEKGEEKLRKMLETDDGARRIGEIAFGLNYNIARATKEILLDEKMGGTMHLALGAAYPETGGKNKSAIHWDFITDLRRGKVYGDGELIYENGEFLL